MNSKTTQIKQAVAKIDIKKINGYLQENPKSKTLKEIAKYSKRALDSNEEAKVFKSSAGSSLFLVITCPEIVI